MAEPPRWEAASVVERGARHVSDGTPCQDAARVYQDGDMVIVAVADGHGDPKHARSEDGSRIAVEVTCELLRELGQSLLRESEPSTPLAVEKRLRRHLPGRISWEWNRRVRAHAGHSGDDGGWHADTQLYGSTILGALFTRAISVFVQLGDGDILVVHEHGPVESIFLPDANIFGSITHSLCQPSSLSHARVRCRAFSPTVRLAMLSTDGVRDSLGDDEAAFLSVGDWLLRRITARGWEPALAALPDWLAELSRRGNGDDVTIGVVHWRPATP
ncbi:MAG: serine/threonine protein phosphatase PrpC [Myxococcota bacterium]|jgi:serine/threonine protein phosphatase PrpC